jgi:hypothetical protein
MTECESGGVTAGVGHWYIGPGGDEFGWCYVYAAALTSDNVAAVCVAPEGSGALCTGVSR